MKRIREKEEQELLKFPAIMKFYNKIYIYRKQNRLQNFLFGTSLKEDSVE